MDGRNSPTNKANWAYKHYSFRFERPPLEDMFKDNLRKNSDSPKNQVTISTEELEQLYATSEQRERDYQVAVDIGKLLLEKNKELEQAKEQLSNDIKRLKIKYEKKQKASMDIIDEEDVGMSKSELKEEVKRLKLQLQLLQSGHGDAESKLIELSQQYSEVERKYKQIVPELNHFKQKAKSLSEELEEYKTELEQSQNVLRELRQNNASLKSSLKEKDVPTNEQQANDSIVAENEKLSKMLHQTRNELNQLREEYEKKQNENELLQQFITSISSENKFLKEQIEEELVLLEEKETRIESLLNELNEKNMMVSSVNTSIAAELEMEFDASEIRNLDQTNKGITLKDYEIFVEELNKNIIIPKQSEVYILSEALQSGYYNIQFNDSTGQICHGCIPMHLVQRVEAFSQSPLIPSPNPSTFQSSIKLDKGFSETLGENESPTMNQARLSQVNSEKRIPLDENSHAESQKSSSLPQQSLSTTEDKGFNPSVSNAENSSNSYSPSLAHELSNSAQVKRGESLNAFKKDAPPLPPLPDNLKNQEESNKTSPTGSKTSKSKQTDKIVEFSIPKEDEMRSSDGNKTDPSVHSILSSSASSQTSEGEQPRPHLREQTRKVGKPRPLSSYQKASPTSSLLNLSTSSGELSNEMQELIKLRKLKEDEKKVVNLVKELQERLFDSDLKNLARTFFMHKVNVFRDLMYVSNTIIDSVKKDVETKLQTFKDQPLALLIGDLILEICVLRKRANDYAEGINQATLEKLEAEEKEREKLQQEREKLQQEREKFEKEKGSRASSTSFSDSTKTVNNTKQPPSKEKKK